MTPVIEHTAMALVALSDLKHHLKMVGRLGNQGDRVEGMVRELERMEREVVAVVKSAQGAPVVV